MSHKLKNYKYTYITNKHITQNKKMYITKYQYLFRYLKVKIKIRTNRS